MVDRRESGYALLAVLWVSVAITGLGMLVSTTARTAIAESHNRIALLESGWRAEGCLAQAQATVVSLARADSTRMGREAWNGLDEALRTTTGTRAFPCHLTIRAVGSRLDVNACDAAILSRLFRELRVRPGFADTVANAVVAREPFISLSQLHRVPGIDSIPRIDSVLDVEPGPAAINHAPAEVLALLPGFTWELAVRVVEARQRHDVITNFVDLEHGLTASANDTLARGSARLMGTAVLDPAGWVLTIRSSSGRPAVTTVVEARVIGGKHWAAVSRRRSWIE